MARCCCWCSQREILTFCADAADIDDCAYQSYVAEAGWSRDTRNRIIFPSRGGLFSLGTDVAVPLSDDDLTFYKMRLSKTHYMPLSRYLTFMVDGELAHARPYGDSQFLSPQDRYFAGGISTVRGYRANSLGPRDSNLDPMGGDTRLLGRTELIFPPPWSLDNRSMRFRAFFDAGNVYDYEEGVELDELRYSGGISLSWFTPVGPLTFSYARPLNKQDGDRTERFQFTLGTP